MLGRPGRNWRLHGLTAIFLLLVTFPCITTGQQSAIKFSTSIRPSSGSTSDIFTFSVNVEGQSQTSYPFLVGGDDFRLTLIGPQSSVQVVNGVVSQKISYIYQLSPKKAGKLLTPAAEIEIDGTKFSAVPLEVEVRQSDTPTNVEGPIFVTQSASKEHAYVGEQIVNAVQLFASQPVMQPQIDDLNADGFWSEEIERNSDLSRHLNGKQYDLSEIRSALFPLRAGELIVPARTFSGQLRERRKAVRAPFPFGNMDPLDLDAFDDFFGIGKMKPFSSTSNAIKIEVKELPALPPDFPRAGLPSPLVGSVTVSTAYDSAELDVGENRTVEVRVVSDGNLNPLKKLPLPHAASFKIYEENPQITKRSSAGRLRFEFTQRFSIVPLEPGTVQISPIRIGYFDPEQGQYKIAETAPIILKVKGQSVLPTPRSQAHADAESSSPSAQPISANTPSSAPLEPGLSALFPHISLPALLLGLVTLAVVLLCGALVLRRRSRLAPLRSLERRLQESHEIRELDHVLSEALFRFLGIGPNLAGEALRAELKRALPERDLQLEALSLLERLQHALYSGQPAAHEFEAFKSRVLNLLRALGARKHI